MIIYKTTNLINGKFYVGKNSTNNPEYLGSGLLLIRAIKKYGKENFNKEILEHCESLSELDEREKYWIKILNAQEEGYNIAEGGSGGKTTKEPWNKGKTENPESTAKRIASLTGRKQSEETKLKRIESLKGQTRSDETKQKMSKSQLGKHHTEETKEKLRQATIIQFSSVEARNAVRDRQLGRVNSEESKRKCSASLKGRPKIKKS